MPICKPLLLHTVQRLFHLVQGIFCCSSVISLTLATLTGDLSIRLHARHPRSCHNHESLVLQRTWTPDLVWNTSLSFGKLCDSGKLLRLFMTQCPYRNMDIISQGFLRKKWSYMSKAQAWIHEDFLVTAWPERQVLHIPKVTSPSKLSPLISSQTSASLFFSTCFSKNFFPVLLYILTNWSLTENPRGRKSCVLWYNRRIWSMD